VSKPTISVIIPTCNRQKALGCCLDALAAQTMVPGSFEVIVVDDGAKEPLWMDASKWAERFSLLVVRQENAGPATARNRGVAEARGEFIAFTDDDCLPEPAWLETLIGAVRTNPEALCGTITFNDLKDDVWAATSQVIIDLVYAYFNTRPHDAYFLTSNNIACRRAIFLEMGGFDTGFSRAGAEDREFCDRWRMSRRPIHLIPSPLLQHRHHQSLRKFVDIHYRYGRGAFVYQSKRLTRGSGTMKEDMGFHRSLPRLLGRMDSTGRGMCCRAGILIGLAIWQFVNAAGFFSAVVLFFCKKAQP
jgi:glycosyltransferase involved in cell wall biosynthesis